MVAEVAYLHIGTEKTGTSSIQQFLTNNRERLLQRGFLFPLAAGAPNNLNLTRYAQRRSRLDTLRRSIGIEDEESLAEFQRDFRRKFRAEADANPHEVMLLSSEHCSSRLTEPTEIQKLAELLKSYAKRVVVICYLRRQDEVALSLYSTSVRSGATEPFAFPEPDRKKTLKRYDYADLLQKWGDVFGSENLTVRRFGSGYFEGGGLISDYLGIVGLSEDGFRSIARANSSVDVRSLEYVRRYNALSGGERHDPVRLNLWKVLEATSHGPPLGATAKARRQFVKQFEAGNRSVARDYLGEDVLFSHPFPDDDTGPVTLDVDDAIRIAASVWTQEVANSEEGRRDAFRKFRKGQAIKKKAKDDHAAVERDDDDE